MAPSMREIARCIDRLYPPAALSELAGRFRYPETEVGVAVRPVSLRALEARVQGPQCSKLEVLHYNTYLLETNLELADLFKLVTDWGAFMLALNLTYADVLCRILEKVGSKGVCQTIFPTFVEVCGETLNVDPLYYVCIAIGDLGALAAQILDHFGGAIDAVLDLFAWPAKLIGGVIFELLGEMLGLVVDLEITPKGAEDRDQRAYDIGAALWPYDLVSLCEVWREEHRASLLSLAPHGAYFCGPPEPTPDEWQHAGSGLLAFSPTQRPIWQDDSPLEYAEAGVHRYFGNCDLGAAVDADKWVCKGAQLTLVDVGCGTLEVYSTHLYSGGDMPGAMNTLFGGEPTEDEKKHVRMAQIGELAEFIRKTHRPERVAIILGDFNVAPDMRTIWVPEGEPGVPHPGLYELLLEIEEGLKFDDWYWLRMFRDIYPPFYVDTQPTEKDLGHTSRGGGSLTFDSHCPFSAPADGILAGGHAVAAGDAVGHLIQQGLPDYYCNEKWVPANPQATGDRIDYVFVQRPEGAHAFNLDVSRIRRRTFKRSLPENELYLSDHVGLELTLFASPR